MFYTDGKNKMEQVEEPAGQKSLKEQEEKDASAHVCLEQSGERRTRENDDDPRKEPSGPRGDFFWEKK